MAWLGERNDRRRRRGLAGLGSRGTGWGLRELLSRRVEGGRFLSACLFVLVVVGVSDVGYLPPDLRVGAQLEQDLKARVSFSYVDLTTTNALRQRARESTPRVYDDVEGWVDEILHGARRMILICATSQSLQGATQQLAREGLRVDAEKLFGEISALTTEQARTEIIRPLEADIKSSIYQEIVILEEKDYQVELRADRMNLRQNIVRRRTESGHEQELEVDILARVYSVADAANYLRHRISQVLGGRSENLQGAIAELAEKRMSPNVRLDQERTRAAQEAAAATVQEVVEVVPRGAVIARRGDVLGQEQYQKLVLESRAFQMSRPLHARALRLLGMALAASVIVATFMGISRFLGPAGLTSGRRLAALAVLVVAVVTVTRVLALLRAPIFLAPACYVAIAAGLMFPTVVAIAAAVGAAVLMGMVANAGHSLYLALASGAVMAALLASRARRPADILRAGAFAGVMQFLASAGMDLAGGIENAGVVLNHGGWGLLSGMASGLLVVATLSVMEPVFGVTTSLSLLELTDQNQPILRQLILRAPGTYHHSYIVGNLSEAGAEAIGADQLLTRTAGYYHDIGKLTKPEYYSENQTPGRSRHDRLTAPMSTLIIISHVKDGVDLAREYGLPRVIRNIIEQHHGTSRVEYFYRQAMSAGGGAPVDEESFRYQGPKPQTREAGVVLIADTIEAASRSLEDPSPARIGSLVHDLIMGKLLDGQFDECDLTLKDLNTVERALVRALTTMFHRRVRYPGSDEEEAKPPEPPVVAGEAPEGES